MNYIAPSLRTLADSGLDMRDTTPEQIRAVWHAPTLDAALCAAGVPVNNRGMTRVESRLMILDRMLQTYGIEYLGKTKRGARHVWYLNTGDTYAATLVAIGRRLIVSDWGSLIESGTIRAYDRFTGLCA